MAMPTVRFKPVLHEYRRVRANPRFQSQQQSKQTTVKSTLHFSKKILSVSNFCRFKPRVLIKATSSVQTSVEVPESADVLFSETFQFKRTETVEGKILVRLEQGKQSNNWQLNVGCNIAGKWVLHWGVTYWDSLSRALGRSLSKNIQGLSKFFSTILHQFSAEPYMIGNEWDQPPREMVPSGSIPIKGYAIETPLKKSQSAVEGQMLHEVQIDFNRDSPISAIHFVLKEEETGAWYQHRGRDFRILLTDYLQEDFGAVDDKKGFSIWPGAFDQLFNMKTKESQSKAAGEGKDVKQQKMRVEGFYEEYSILKETPIQNTLTVSVSRSNEKDKNLVLFDTDLPGDVVIHWGVCRDSNKRWEIPQSPHPSNTHIFRDKALQTSLQTKDNGNGSWGLFSLDKEFMGMLFVLKLNEYTWLNNMGKDFYIPIYGPAQSGMVLGEAENRQTKGGIRGSEQSLMEESERDVEVNQLGELTDGIIGEIRNLVGDISSIKSTKTKSKNYHENILQEIERLAAEAYSIFRSSPPTPPLLEEPISVAEPLRPPPKLSPGTGSGYEVLCQGFNWESHKSGRWYLELYEKAAEIASLGFTIVWLPPPTESVSPEGYMPKDLYNLNSRYGSMDELKRLVKRFHEVGVKVLGDAVLNHRCASYKNQNGVWNIFGGRINWDDRAVVADDPHFQGRGNKSSGDNFHAAPNIDHSQDFVRNDLKEWLQWLRKEIGYDGWRLDFVRGFWGGYVKDYIDASEPYFCVGEFWDSLSYTYGEMDHNQDAHRQRIVDWINATGGSAGAFDVTTKGILHSVAQFRGKIGRFGDLTAQTAVGIMNPGFFLNPRFQYQEGFEYNDSIRSGVTKVIERLAPNVTFAIEATREALEKCQYWRLSDKKGKPPGVLGWWPSRAVTFIENHDTGSTQGHWRFPSGKEMQGYAYILTHPGTPAVFYDHIFSHYRDEILSLISLRDRTKIHCRSIVKIAKAERDVYAADIDNKLMVKIGPGHYDPPKGAQNWAIAAEGRDYKVWEAS